MDRTRDAAPGGPSLGRVAAQRLLRHTALARYLQAPFEQLRRGPATMRSSSSWLGCIHSSQPACSQIDGRLPAVVGVGVRAGHQADVLEAQVAHRERALELLERVRLVHAGVEQDEAAVAADRPRVAVRHARPRQRKSQSVDAGQHALAPPELALARHIGHRPETRLRLLADGPWKETGMAEQESASAASTKVQEVAENMQELAGRRRRISPAKAEGVARRYFEAIDARDLDAAVAAWAPRAAARTCAARSTCSRPRACGRSSADMLGALPDLQIRAASRPPRRRTAARSTGISTAPSRAPASFAGHRPTGQCRSSSKGAIC